MIRANQLHQVKKSEVGHVGDGGRARLRCGYLTIMGTWHVKSKSHDTSRVSRKGCELSEERIASIQSYCSTSKHNECHDSNWPFVGDLCFYPSHVSTVEHGHASTVLDGPRFDAYFRHFTWTCSVWFRESSCMLRRLMYHAPAPVSRCRFTFSLRESVCKVIHDRN